jgi:hypothetical protein
MYRTNRLAPFASFFLLAVLLVVFALGSASEVTAETAAPSATAVAPDPSVAPSADPEVVKELVEKRTENSRTYLLKDGRLKSEVFDGPINFQDATGAWRGIDPNLITTASKGEYATAAAPVKVTLTSPSSTADLVTLEAQGAKVGMRMEGTSLGAPVVSGSKALYLSAPSNLLLTYEALGDGLKETITLLSAKSANTFTFTVSHPGLTMWQDQTGTWGLYRLIEEPPVLMLGGLDVHDSSVSDSGDPAFCADATMKVTPGTEQSTVTITVPKKWLADPARRYPVMVDPSYYGQSATADTYVCDKYPSSNYGSSTEMRVGYKDSTTGRSRALLWFALPAAVTNSCVQSATLQLHQNYQWATGAREVRVAQMTRSWVEASATYNSSGSGYDLPYAKQVWSTGQTPQYFSFDFADVVQAWADGGPNYGFVVYTEGGEWLHYRKLDSRECATVAYRPMLTIYYTEPKDVTAFGAVGTDLLDDTAAFQAAIDAVDDGGGVVRVPAGDYYLSGLHLDGAADSKVILRGDGTSSVLLPNPSPAAPIADMILIGGTSAVSNVTLKDFYLRLPAGGNGIRFGSAGGSGITLSGLTLGGGADSSTNYGVSGTTSLTNFTMTNVDLSGVTALPLSLPNGVWGSSVTGTRLPYEPYRADPCTVPTATTRPCAYPGRPIRAPPRWWSSPLGTASWMRFRRRPWPKPTEVRCCSPPRAALTSG